MRKKRGHVGRKNITYNRNDTRSGVVIAKSCVGCNGNEICLIRAEFFLW